LYYSAKACEHAGRTAYALAGYEHFVAVAPAADSELVAKAEARIQALKPE